MKYSISFVLVIVSISGLAAQDAPAPVDSTGSDTLVVRMMEGIGDASPGIPHVTLLDSVWHWSDIRSLPDMFALVPGVYELEKGEEGASADIWYLGADAASEQVLVDGIQLTSSMSPAEAMSLFPLEFVRSIEELDGPTALLAGARWNLRTYQYASPKPRTAVRFVQTTHETIHSDAFFAQNIARSTNLHFGFQRRTSDGRFSNSGLDSWALRGRIRYNITPRLNIMGNWSYEKTSHGLNGGVDPARSANIFDDVTAIVPEPDAYTLWTSSRRSLHVLGDVLDDSLSLTRLTYISTDEEREFNRTTPSVSGPILRQYSLVNAERIRLEQNIALPYMSFRFMGQTGSETAVDSSLLHGQSRRSGAYGASLKLLFTHRVVPSFGVRIDKTPEGSQTSIAAGTTINILNGLSLHGAYERRALLTGLRQTAWTDSLMFLPAPQIGRETFETISARWNFLARSFIEVEGFRREQTDRLLYKPDTSAFGTKAVRGIYRDVTMAGIQLSGQLTVDRFFLSGWLTVMNIDGPAETSTMHPPVWARWEFGWHGTVFSDALGLQASVRGTYYDRHDGLTYDPRTGLSLLQSSVRTGRMTRLDGFVVLRIGDAFLTLAWENILNTDYFKMPTFPMPDRRFSLGVRWTFSD